MKSLFFKAISLILVLSMLLFAGLTACNNPDGAETTPSTPEETPNPPQNLEPPEDNYFLPKEDGCNQITFYWVSSKGIENCDIWCWWGDTAGKGYVMQPWGLGGKVVINVPEGVSEVGFIVRTSCSDPGGTSWGNATKDGTDSDRFATISGDETFVYLKSGDANQYISYDGGRTLTMAKKFTFAEIYDFNTIKYTVSPKTKITSLDQIKVYEGDTPLTIAKVSSLNMQLTSGYITLEEKLDITKTYRVEVGDFGSKTAIPMGVFDCDEFIASYTYDGDDLGATINGDKTTFKVWAPTASKIVLNLYKSGHEGEAYEQVEMTLGDKGVWSYTADCGHGTYYTYTVTTAIGTNETADPYARTVGLNGNRSMVVDLSLTNPEGWGEDFKTGIDSYSDAIIWEVHVRDFSNKISSSNYKGKYLAFTERGLVNEHGQPVGVDYLVELGITHVHLLPVYDFATIDEATPEDEFNWGYDPKNYNAPEGSYSTDPYNGEVRIKEYKQMVKALHDAGIGVIMDVVYNHTYDANSSFHKIVPYYYYRYTSTGANSSASGCGNDTASERYMYGKFMVDSVKYWAEEYDLDGFRFDLMGLHDLETMRNVEIAVHAINSEAIIYGEGWTMGSTIDGSAMANQSNISKIEPSKGAIGSVAVFNDAIRDGLKGSVFEEAGQGYINGKGSAGLAKVLFGIRGGTGTGIGWTVENAMVINYMSAHDNLTLWDKLLASTHGVSDETRYAMNRLGATIIMVSKGTPFWQAGEEMLRTKGGDENSYKSSDEVNNIDWSVLSEGSAETAMMKYYKNLINVRKAYGVFTDTTSVLTETKLSDGRFTVLFESANGEKALVVSNPTAAPMTYELEGTWYMVVNGIDGNGTPTLAEGTVTVPAYSAVVFVNEVK